MEKMMIDELPAIQMIAPSETTVTLPFIGDNTKPIVQIMSRQPTVTVFDDGGRRLLTLDVPGQSAVFEIERPKWWQFWELPRWKHVR
jgi:hypothetical protein